MSIQSAAKVKALELPCNLDLERALVGAVLLDNRALERLPDRFDEAAFHDPIHGQIYAAIRDVAADGQLASAATLRTAFPGLLPGGQPIAHYLDTLIATATTLFNVSEYAKVLLDLAHRRALMRATEDVTLACAKGAVEQPLDKIVEGLDATLLKISAHAPSGADEITFEQALDLAIERANDAYQRGSNIVGLSSGLNDLDKLVGGLAPSDLLILGGRPGSGKTSLATAIAYNVASKHLLTHGGAGAPVHFFSQEMSAEQLASRVLAERVEISSEAVRRGNFKTSDMARMMEMREIIGKTPIVIDQTGGLSIAQLAARARRLKRTSNTGLIVIDYIQLMFGSSKENRNQDLTRITNGLKALAKELGLPIIALSQLSRGVENREDKRPHLADLRESGSIEQDADIVLFIYREAYYLEQSKPDDTDIEKKSAWDAKMAACRNKAEVLVAKHRHGPTGRVELQFTPEFTRFSDLVRASIPDGAHR
jgi:replicative DNA helicase